MPLHPLLTDPRFASLPFVAWVEPAPYLVSVFTTQG